MYSFIYILKNIRILTYEVGMALFNIICNTRSNRTYSHFIKSKSSNHYVKTIMLTALLKLLFNRADTADYTKILNTYYRHWPCDFKLIKQIGVVFLPRMLFYKIKQINFNCHLKHLKPTCYLCGPSHMLFRQDILGSNLETDKFDSGLHPKGSDNNSSN